MHICSSPHCDGFMVGSTKTDVSIGAVEIPHEGPEEYNNIWQKVRSMWSYIYDNYYDKYDWFHIGGDDIYLIVENLRLYLESEEILTAQNGGIYLPEGGETMETPLFLGRRFAYQGDREDIFISGGSGYTMNKAALKALVVDGFPKYFPHAHTFSEDTMVARIFKKMDVFPYDTKDEDGGERYNPFQVSPACDVHDDTRGNDESLTHHSLFYSRDITGATVHRRISAKTGTQSIQLTSNGARSTVQKGVSPSTTSRTKCRNGFTPSCIICVQSSYLVLEKFLDCARLSPTTWKMLFVDLKLAKTRPLCSLSRQSNRQLLPSRTSRSPWLWRRSARLQRDALVVQSKHLPVH